MQITDISQYVSTSGSSFSVDAEFVRILTQNFNAVQQEINNRISVALASNSTNLAQMVESKQAWTATMADGVTRQFPSGLYLKSGCLGPVAIAAIADDETYVKMTAAERAQLATLVGSSSPGHFKLKLADGTVLDGLMKLVPGNLIKVTQLPTVNGEYQVKIESEIPAHYFRIHKYSVVPTRPDPRDPYRFRVSESPYAYGSLRVYVNTHRIPDSSIRQDRANQGEFYFDRSIDLAELPRESAGDIVCCDFEVPVIPAASASTTRWWADYLNVPFMKYDTPTPDVAPYQAFKIPAFSGLALGDWVGIVDSAHVSNKVTKGTIVKLDVRKVNEVGSVSAPTRPNPAAPEPGALDWDIGTASSVRPIGVVVEIDSENAWVAFSGLVRAAVFAVDCDISTHHGKTFYISKDYVSKRGRMTPSDAADANFEVISSPVGDNAITGLYKLPVGECVRIGNNNFLMIRFGDPVFKTV